MKEQIETIIQQHCELLQTLDTNKNIAQVVKSIDNLTQETYMKIYALRDGRKNGTYEAMTKKHGHCC
jgi:hypothetical protein